VGDDAALLLRSSISVFGTITDEDWIAFSSIWTEIEVSRKMVLTKTKQIECHVYFVLDGIQRLCYLDDDGNESTLILTYKGNFGGVLDSYLLQHPSNYDYETLSKSRLLKCGREDFEKIKSSCPNVRNAIDKAIYLAFSGTMTRLTELQCLSSEEKFKQLLKRSPHVLQKIPHKYLANYIGIDPTNFSKLFNSIKI